jgi:hypothetical protein
LTKLQNLHSLHPWQPQLGLCSWSQKPYSVCTSGWRGDLQLGTVARAPQQEVVAPGLCCVFHLWLMRVQEESSPGLLLVEVPFLPSHPGLRLSRSQSQHGRSCARPVLPLPPWPVLIRLLPALTLSLSFTLCIPNVHQEQQQRTASPGTESSLCHFLSCDFQQEIRLSLPMPPGVAVWRNQGRMW